MVERVAVLADAASDRVGLGLEEERLPQRIHLRRPSRRSAR